MMIVGKNNKDKYIITMIIITIFATVVNYGLFNLFKYFFPTYEGVEVNMVFVLSIIGIVTVLMFILLPSDKVNDMTSISNIETRNKELTPEQQLQEMIDDEDFSNHKNDDDENQ